MVKNEFDVEFSKKIAEDFKDKVNSNGFLKKHKIKAVNGNTYRFWKVLSVISVILLFSGLGFLCYLGYNEKFKSLNSYNSTCVCEAVDIPECPKTIFPEVSCGDCNPIVNVTIKEYYVETEVEP